VKTLGSFLEFEIIITNDGVEIKVVHWRNHNAALNFFKFLFFICASKVLTSSVVGFHEAKGST
jgi:hypothetical protein